VKLHLDTFHMNIEEKNQAAAILKAGKHLGHFHACGTDRGTPGNDSLDWQPIVAGFERASFGILLLLIFIAPGILWAMVAPVRSLFISLMPGF